MDYSKKTLGELVSHRNMTIRRNAMSILKTLQRGECKHEYDRYGKCCICGYWDIDGDRNI